MSSILKRVLDEIEKGRSALNLIVFDEKISKLSLAGITVAPLHDYFLPSVFAAFESQIGPATRTLVIRYAKEVGLRDGIILREIAINKKKFDVEEIVKIAVDFFRMWCNVGWGKMASIEFKDGYACLVRETSFEGEGYLKLGKGPAKTSRCIIALGYVLGVLEGLLKKKVVGEETECIGKGDKVCKFEVRWW